MTTFFNFLRRCHPDYAAVALHIRNEGKRTKQQIDREKLAGGFVKGASDIIIPAGISFVCEMKSQSPKATITEEQINFLLAAQSIGAFAVIALGHEAAIEAFKDWLKLNKC